VVAVGGFLVNSTTTTALATAAFGVIGSVVGAYFGVKIGTDSTQTAIQAQLQEAAKSQVYAAHLPTQQADEVLNKAQNIAERTHARSRG
jgi:NH3-dependent NAD+ synthetase